MSLQILGIGNPIMDMSLRIDPVDPAGDALMAELASLLPGLEWNCTFHLDASLFDRILACFGMAAGASPLEGADLVFSPEGPLPPSIERVPGGGALNTVRILSGLGHPSGFVGGLGEDEWSDLFRRELISRGIEDYTCSFPPAPCGRSLIIKGEMGEIALFSPGAAGELIDLDAVPLPYYPGRAEEPEGLAGQPRLICLEGFLLPRRKLVEQVLSLRESWGALLALDLGAAPLAAAWRDFLLKEIIPSTTFLFGTREEFDALGISPEEAAKMLASRVDASRRGSCAVMKMGASGSRLYFDGCCVAVAASPVPGQRETGRAETGAGKVVDTLGAGDVYAAFFLSRVLRGSSFEEAADAASRGSALSLLCFGGNIEDFRD